MKGLRLLSVILALTAATCIRAYAANSSVEVKIGGRLWYCWWQPAWSDGVRYVTPSAALPVSLPYKTKRYDVASAFMYGFTVSVRFLESWIFSSSLMYGNFFSKSETPGSHVALSLPALNFSKDIKMYDIDADLGYQATRYLRVNLRVKTRPYNYIEKGEIAHLSPSGRFSIASAKAEFIDVGPGLGVELSLPLYRSLSLLMSVSGFVLAGSGSYVYDYQYDATPSAITLVLDQFNKESFYSYAGNGAVALEYYIQPADIALQIGGKYDLIYYRQHRTMKGFLGYGGKYDRFYGVSFAAVYSFTLTDIAATKQNDHI
ncbi:MAG: hypothetical protein A2W19_11330 [Spirochaetes bacterium RBG_16_49_21]|nr:MAG: hypothetical protein A2W19_11330 [Spirochaetes bacterium RBG_16_49_21]